MNCEPVSFCRSLAKPRNGLVGIEPNNNSFKLILFLKGYFKEPNTSLKIRKRTSKYKLRLEIRHMSHGKLFSVTASKLLEYIISNG